MVACQLIAIVAPLGSWRKRCGLTAASLLSCQRARTMTIATMTVTVRATATITMATPLMLRNAQITRASAILVVLVQMQPRVSKQTLRLMVMVRFCSSKCLREQAPSMTPWQETPIVLSMSAWAQMRLWMTQRVAQSAKMRLWMTQRVAQSLTRAFFVCCGILVKMAYRTTTMAAVLRVCAVAELQCCRAPTWAMLQRAEPPPLICRNPRLGAATRKCTQSYLAAVR